jgi:hypothetical protein
MSSFGDFDLDDALDHEPPAPEQVAYRLHSLRLEVDALAGAAELPTWDDLTPAEQSLGLSIGAALVDWLVTHAPDATDAARSLHNVRRFIASSRLPPWDELEPDDRALGVALMALIIGWLQRQGALT